MDQQPQNMSDYMSVEDFFADAEDCPAVEEVFKELEEEADKTLLDEVALRRQEDWSVVAHQIVGAEGRATD